MSRLHRNITVRSIIIAATISIFIGIVLMFLGSHTFNHSLIRYLLNAGYSLFIGLGLFSNGFVFNLIEPRFISWIDRPGRSIVIAIVAHLIYSSVVIFGVSWIYFGKLLDTPEGQFWNYYKYTLISVLTVTIFITSIIYAKSFFKAYRNEAIQSEKLKKEAITLQYQIMQNQVNPHFLFNSLNILGTLIDIDTEKAKQFTRELALFYRELLYFKDVELVPISDELNFVKKYIYLQKIRFGDNFSVDLNVSSSLKGELIPMSIQMLLENAVKHNIISKDHPLKIDIGTNNPDEIYVENNYQPKVNMDGSNKIGLKNLTNRYNFLSDKKMKIEQTPTHFKVTLPIIQLEK
ncbi:MAG: sensor histidine kinase [Prolixibacteraceae bacterium]